MHVWACIHRSLRPMPCPQLVPALPTARAQPCWLPWLQADARKAHQEARRLEKELGSAEARALQAEAAAQRARCAAESDAKSSVRAA